MESALKNLFVEFERAKERSQLTRLRRFLLRPMATTLRYVGVRVCTSLNIFFPMRARLFWGQPMHVVFPEYVSTGLIYDGFTEADVTHFIMLRLKQDSTFIDVGAHFGYFSLLASTCVGGTGKVISFEPTPSTYRILEQNARAVSNVKTLNIGLYSNKGSIPFKDFGIGHSAFNTMYRGAKPVTSLFKVKGTEISVPVITLDEYCNENHCRPDVLKIDAETAEYEVLRGAKETIGKCHPDISIEVGGGAGDAGSSHQAVDYLLSVGYQQYVWVNERLVRANTTSDDFSNVANLFFIHSSKSV